MTDISQNRLEIKHCPLLTYKPFSEEELRLFDTPEVCPERHDIKSIRQTYYDRSQGGQIRLMIETLDGRTVCFQSKSLTTGVAMAGMKKTMPTIAELTDATSLFRTSMGNVGADLPGNFLVFPDGNNWKLFCSSNEPLNSRCYHALILMNDQRRKIGEISFSEFSEGVPSAIYWEGRRLNPADIKWILVTTVIGWKNVASNILLSQEYPPSSDLRHLFRLPYFAGAPLFYDQLVHNPELLHAAFSNADSEFEIPDGLDINSLKALLTPFRYTEAIDQASLEEGQYRVGPGAKIKIRLLSARYPINVLAVSEDGLHMASVIVGGESGKSGANYWTFYGDIQALIAQKWGWEPDALFVLDNGQDVQIATIDGGSISPIYSHPTPRNEIRAALNVMGAV